MADQAAVTKTNGYAPSGENSGGDVSTTESCASAVVTNVAGFGEDLLNLAELQARLAALEVRQNLDSVKTGGALIATGVIVAMSALSGRPCWYRRIARIGDATETGLCPLDRVHHRNSLSRRCGGIGGMGVSVQADRLPAVRRRAGTKRELGSDCAPPEAGDCHSAVEHEQTMPTSRARCIGMPSQAGSTAVFTTSPMARSESSGAMSAQPMIPST